MTSPWPTDLVFDRDMKIGERRDERTEVAFEPLGAWRVAWISAMVDDCGGNQVVEQIEVGGAIVRILRKRRPVGRAHERGASAA